MSLYYDENAQRFWFQDGTGRQQPVPDPSERDLAALVDLFRIRFGRDPGPGDPLLFDPRQDKPTPLPEQDVRAAVAQLLEELEVHPAYQYAYRELGYLITVDNARFARPEDVARWGQVVSAYLIANTCPELPSLVLGSVKPRVRLGPEYAAVQEALALSDQAGEREKLVIGFVCAKRGTTHRVAVVYSPEFVATCVQNGGGPDFGEELVLADNTPGAFEPHCERGWIPVAVAFGDDSPHATFITVRAGVYLTQAGEREATEQAMVDISALLARMRE